MTVTALIADDEPLLRRELRATLSRLWPALEVVDEVGDGAQVVAAVARHRPTVVFLDVRMPVMDGIAAAERIQGDTHIVFITAYDEHAVAAFERGAVDYLLKPVSTARLEATVQRLQRRAVGKDAVDLFPRLRWIQASIGNVLRFVPVDEVCYFQADEKYTRLVTATDTALIRKPLKELLAVLDPEAFWRINRSTIINLNHVESVVREGGETVVVMRGTTGVHHRVSKSYQALFRAM